VTQEIKKVALLGANGTMGYGSGALFTSAGCDVVFLARSEEKAQAGLTAAQNQVRATSVANRVSLGSYDNDLEEAITDADLIFESVAEDLDIKNDYFEKIDKYRRPDSIVATVSSGLSITDLAANRSESFQKHFVGLHYFNPPNVITGTEIIPGQGTDPAVVDFLVDWCTRNQQRTIIKTFNTPGFAGNRIGFKVLNEVAQLAEQHGAAFMEYLVGPYTGRSLPALATIDLVGWDVHKAIVDNVAENVSAEVDEALDKYLLPAYMQKGIDEGMLGNKTGGGYFKNVDKERFCLDIASGDYVSLASISLPKLSFIEEIRGLHNEGNYHEAMTVFATAEGEEARLAQQVIGGYISHSFNRVGEVTEDITAIDLIMGMGFNWAPPSVLVDTIGLEPTVKMLEKVEIPVPKALQEALDNKRTEPFFNTPNVNTGRFFIAN